MCDTTGEIDRLLERYLSLLVVDSQKGFAEKKNIGLKIKCDCSQLQELYEKRVNIVQIEETGQTCYDRDEDDDEVEITLECDKHGSKKFRVNPLNLFRGVRHVWKLEQTDGKAALLFMSMMEKMIFIDSKIKCNFYDCEEFYEPFIVEKETRNRIILEIIAYLYETSVLRKENEDKLVTMKFFGDKHLVNVWKRGIRMGTWLELKDHNADQDMDCVKPNIENRQPGEHVFYIEFCHAKTQEVMLSTVINMSFDMLEKIIKV